MPRARLQLACLLALALVGLAPGPGGPARQAHALSKQFPSPPALAPQVRFWTRIYSEVGTDGALIHDSENLDIVYERVDFPDDLGSRSLDRRFRETKSRYARILKQLASGQRSGLDRESQRVLRLFPDGVSNATLRRAAENVRLQRGQADRFREGVIRAGAWEDYIRGVMARKQLPLELVTLPHVESSFNPEAWSKVGAAGMWQFMPRTAREFMRVDAAVDQRMDPFVATDAAADYLKRNHRLLDTWPLALTAYNHGAGGLLRAKRELGTSDIATIVKRYKGRAFGFASRNFYTSFLAAHEVSSHYERYFGPLRRQRPLEYRELVLEKPYSVKMLKEALGVDVDVLRSHNLALRDAVWSGRRRVPAGVRVRVPKPGQSRFEEAPPPTERYRPTAHDLARLAAAHQPGAGDPAPPMAALATLAEAGGEEVPGRDGTEPRPPAPGGPAADRARAASSGPDEAPAPVPAERGPEPVLAERGPEPVVAMAVGTPRRRAWRPAPPPDAVPALDPPPAGRAVEPTSAPGAVPAAELRPGAASSPPPRLAPAPPPVQAPGGAGAEASDGATLERDALAEALAELRAAEERARARRAGAAGPPPVESDALPARVRAALHGQAETAPRPGSGPPPPPERHALGASIEEARYRVRPDGSVRIRADENLNLMARWTGHPVETVRRLNQLRPGARVGIGQRLRLDFSRVPQQHFEARRIAYHQALRDEFFRSFQVARVEQRVVREGDTLWSLSRGATPVPTWLIRSYNPGVDFGSLRPGSRIAVPLLERREG